MGTRIDTRSASRGLSSIYKGENMNIIEGIVLIIGIICTTLLGLSYILKDEINKK